VKAAGARLRILGPDRPTWYGRAAHQGYREAQVALASLALQDRGEGGPR